MAWILNFQASAVAMESTSLSDYIYENGGPIVTGKEAKANGRIPCDKHAKDIKGPYAGRITTKLLRDKQYF